MENREQLSQKDNYAYTILCSGDSFTYGLGAPSNMAYPVQLERMLKDKFGGRNINVINKGGGGSNTAHLLYRSPYKIEDNIEKIQPDIIVLLVGGQNLWNYWGYGRCLDEKEISSKIKNILYRVRLYKLVKLFYTKIREKIYRKKIMTGLRIKKDEYEGGLNKKDSSVNDWVCVSNGDDAEIIRCRNVTNRDVSLQDISLGRLYIKLGKIFSEDGEYEEAIKWYKKAIEKNKKNKNVCADIYCSIGETNLFISEYSEVIKWCKKAIEIDSENFRSYCTLGKAYRDMNFKKSALMCYKKALKINPLYFQNYREVINLSIELNKYEENINFLQQFVNIYPEVKSFIIILKNKKNIIQEIKKWVKQDLKKIIKICRENRVKLILQNYPVYTEVNSLLKQIAKEENIIFIDNYRSFRILLKQGGNGRKYLSADEKHCNADGYRIIAGNVYNRILKEKLIKN